MHETGRDRAEEKAKRKALAKDLRSSKVQIEAGGDFGSRARSHSHAFAAAALEARRLALGGRSESVVIADERRKSKELKTALQKSGFEIGADPEYFA